MPYFNTQPSSNLAASLRKAIGGGAGLSASDLSAIDGKAADTAYKMTLADKARAEMAAAERETAETGRTCTVFEVRIIHNTTAPKEKPTCTA